MLNNTDKFAETTNVDKSGDVLDDALRSLRIGGSVLLREAYAPPCAIAVPSSDKLAAFLGLKQDTMAVAFHLVEFGHCEIKSASGNHITLTAGELAIMFGGEAHTLSQGKSNQIADLETMLAGGPNIQKTSAAQAGLGVSLLCGVFMLHQTQLNPLFAALPAILRVNLSRQTSLHNLSGIAHIMAHEIERSAFGAGFIVERLLEILCAEAVRAHLEVTPQQAVGWFRGIKDPVVGRAIKAIHQNPAQDWSIPRLAGEVAMSPSRFAARFSESLGESPMAYVAKWRMNVACRKLSASRIGVDQVAADVGYESVAAFNRAFKKHLGLPPAAWRSQQAS
ncbi:AraC family transcriptional regulator [Undibacterium sp.]|uniref:AraC family transcriptional regulator n=1 Tax=Undibacterium sp. TaxID=1914977 RepID=UPI0025EB0328|nr:AraC family transcriptional regulator [Undibacterium sp.]